MARKKKRSGSGKKRRRRSVEKRASPDAANATAPPSDAPAEQPGAVEEVVDRGPHEEPRASASPPLPSPDAPITGEDADQPAVVDLDDDADPDDLAALIAGAVAGAPSTHEPSEPEPPLIDLDEEPAPVGQTESAAQVEAPAPAAPLPPAEEPAAPPPPAPREHTAAGDVAAGDDAGTRLPDLGPVSSPEVRDRLLAAALAHAEHQDARYRVPYSAAAALGAWKVLVGLVILVVAGLVALAPPGWARPEGPAPLSTVELAHGLRIALLLQAEQVEAFRAREQRLPASLTEVGDSLPGLRYVRSGTRAYQLVAYLPDGSAVVYDSTSPARAFAATATRWKPPEGAPR